MFIKKSSLFNHTLIEENMYNKNKIMVLKLKFSCLGRPSFLSNIHTHVSVKVITMFNKKKLIGAVGIVFLYACLKKRLYYENAHGGRTAGLSDGQASHYQFCQKHIFYMHGVILVLLDGNVHHHEMCPAH